MSLGGDCPLVSGVSPNEGLPGTKVTIRGENLGSRKEDILCKQHTYPTRLCVYSPQPF